MSNNTIYERILEKGVQESNKITKQAEDRANEIIQLAIEETNKTLSFERKKLQARLDEIYKTKMTEFEQALKQNALMNKKQLLDLVFLEAKTKLTAFNDTELSKLVISILSKDTLLGKEKIRVNKKDYDRYLRLFSSRKDGNLDLLNDVLKQGIKLTLDKESANITGGFIVISEAYDIDHSFDTIISTLYNQLESEIASILFTGAQK